MTPLGACALASRGDPQVTSRWAVDLSIDHVADHLRWEPQRGGRYGVMLFPDMTIPVLLPR